MVAERMLYSKRERLPTARSRQLLNPGATVRSILLARHVCGTMRTSPNLARLSSMKPVFLLRAKPILFTFAVIISHPANSACGSAFCTVNTDWASRGEWTEPGGRLDLRYEYIRQAQPRAGAESVEVGQVPGQEHDEVRTINRNYVVQFDYNFNERWGLSAIVPFVSRDHEHIHNDEATGEREPEAWHFNEFADARIYGRYQLQLHSEAPSSLGFALGLKLPTGPYDITNDQ